MCWMISRERVVVAALALAAGWLAPGGRALNARIQVDAIASLRTVPDRTGSRETSRYADVMDFVRAVDAASAAIHLTTFGTTVEKRELPLAVAGAAAATPGAVRATGKLRVYIQANVHGGEVEGKESAQALLRTLAAGARADWLEHMTLLVAPIYNADGNERVALDNRGPQHGPIGGQGQRANAQGLDLNRDHIKLDSPEARAVVRLMNEYDPHVAIDLHTTNGSHHAYLLTYAPPLHPATDPLIVRLLRLEWLPRVTATIRAKHGWDAYYYGNLQGTSRVPGAPDERSWRTFDHRPRFNNNYVGLRNRFAVLSEAYAYASFRDRILATDRFLEENLNYIQANAASIRRITDEADRRNLVGASLPLRAEPERGPAAYFVPAGLTAAIDRLRAYGIALEPLKASGTIDAETFHVQSSHAAAKPFQNHHERTVTGAWTPSRRTLPPGTLRVDMSQPLARLAFYLLEPRSDDGLVNWNVLDDALGRAREYPILRTAR